MTEERIADLLDGLVPINEITNNLLPLAQEIKEIIPKTIPYWIKLFSRRKYRQLINLINGINDPEKLQELVGAICEETKLSKIIKENVRAIHKLTTQIIPPWLVIIVGTVIGIITGVLQLIV